MYYKEFVFEEDDNGYRLVGALNHLYDPKQIVEYFREPEINLSKIKLSEDELVRVRQAAAEAFRSGEEIEDLIEVLTARIRI